MRRTFAVAAAVCGAALAVPGVAYAQTTEPAPDGTASAVAAQVGEIIAVGQTSAKAGQSGSEATANALALGGSPPSEQFGGTVKSTDSPQRKSGRLLDTGEGAPVRLQVTPWEASAEPQGDCRAASGKAALARLTVVDEETAHVNVLQSESTATHCGLSSAGKSSSDGATANVGGASGLLLVLLHSEADSSGAGKTFLVGIGDNEIFTGEDADGQCAIEIPGLLALTCLAVGGGEGTVFADVADLVVGGEGGLAGKVVGAEGSGRPAPTPAEPAVLTGVIENEPLPRTLARTGVELGAMALLGAMLVALGETTRRRFRAATNRA